MVNAAGAAWFGRNIWSACLFQERLPYYPEMRRGFQEKMRPGVGAAAEFLQMNAR